MPEVDRQRRSTHHTAVVELNLVWLMGRSNLAIPLQPGDRIKKRGIRPWFDRSLRLRHGDHLRSRLFDHAEPIEFQPAKDRRLPRPRRASKNESSHVVSLVRKLCGCPSIPARKWAPSAQKWAPILALRGWE